MRFKVGDRVLVKRMSKELFGEYAQKQVNHLKGTKGTIESVTYTNGYSSAYVKFDNEGEKFYIKTKDLRHLKEGEE